MYQDRYILEFKLFLFLTLTSFCVTAQQAAGHIDKEIKAIFSEWSHLESPGAAVAVVHNGKIEYSNSFGSANLEHRTPVTTSTKFQLRAVQNQIISFAVLLLESQGKLSLDDNIRRYLPKMPDLGKPIKIHHLLTHTHGLPDFIALQLLSGVKMEDVKTREESIRMLYGLTDNVFDAGDEYQYCDSGILLASEIITKVSGISFTKFIETQIFQPLGMVNTDFGNVEDSIIKNRASVYSKNGEVFKNENLNYYSLIDFSLYSTAEDMARWMLNFETLRIGSADLVKKMYTPVILNNGTSTYAVIGQFMSEYKGLLKIQQNGRAYGTTTYVVQFPDQDFAAVVLGNAFNFQAKEAALKITDLFLQKEFKEESLPVKEHNATENKFIELNSSELKKFCGDYWNEQSAYTRKIKLKDDKLYYYRSEGNESELTPISTNTFVLTEDPDSYSIRFEKNLGQELMIFAVGDEYEYINVKYDPVIYDAKQLSEFTGLFLCEDLKVMYNLTMQDGKIIASHNRNVDLTITPYKTDCFTSNINYFSNLEFERDRNSGIKGFLIRTTNIGSQYFMKIKN